MPATPSTPRAGWTLAIVSIALFMTALDNLVVGVALPSIRVGLGGSLESLEWTVNAYTLTFAVLLITGAALGRSSAAPSSRGSRGSGSSGSTCRSASCCCRSRRAT